MGYSKVFYNLLRKIARTKTGRTTRKIYRTIVLPISLIFNYIIRAYAFRKYVRSNENPKLHIGAGPCYLKDWLNTDLTPHYSQSVFFLDATKTIPLNDSTFYKIYTEHLIEHLSYENGLFMLAECYRILQPNGKIRISTPNLEKLTGLFAPKKNDRQIEYIKWITDTFLPGIDRYHETFVINNAFRNWGHQFIYDKPTLKDSLEKMGFVEITEYQVGESDDEDFLGIESHGLDINREDINRFESMIFEARRPKG